MDPTLTRCLGDLESRIDPETEERLIRDWVDFTEDRFEGAIFSPRRPHASAPGLEWPRPSVNDALEDFEMMALQQFGHCSVLLAMGAGNLLGVRCNYGTSIIPLLFGVEPFVMDEDLETLPTSRPFNDIEAIRRIVDAGVPDIHSGYGSRVLEMGERFQAIAREYPAIASSVHVYHPDFQGPMDICEVIWGSTMFYSLYDEPELVEALLELVTATYAEFMRAWTRIVPLGEPGSVHWGLFHKGGIMLRDDSAMNLSPDMFDRFVRPYDQRLLDEFGGGAIHFCGKGDHYIARMSEMPGLKPIQLSQPEYNAMETIYAHTVDKGINIIGLHPSAAEAATAAGRALHGRVHCY